MAIVDLTDGRAILKNADRVFPTASSIRIAILLELYYQEQQARDGSEGKARLNDLYDVDPKVLVDFSAIMAGLTPGLTKVTNRDIARTDSGIILAKNRPFAISVITAHDRDERAAERAISEIALEAYRHFEMRGKTTECGRVLEAK